MIGPDTVPNYINQLELTTDGKRLITNMFQELLKVRCHDQSDQYIPLSNPDVFTKAYCSRVYSSPCPLFPSNLSDMGVKSVWRVLQQVFKTNFDGNWQRPGNFLEREPWHDRYRIQSKFCNFLWKPEGTKKT
jgi:hypothetical protein